MLVHVVLEFVGICKATVAAFANMWSSFHVYGHVTFDMAGLREASITHFTHVRFDVAVRQHVCLQVTYL